MKIPEMVLSYILKKGLVYDAQNVEIDFVIPGEKVPALTHDQVRVYFKAENMTIKIDKDS